MTKNLTLQYFTTSFVYWRLFSQPMMARPFLPKSIVSLAVLAILSGCAINPQTGQAEISPEARAQFNSIFDSPDPCSNNDRNIGIALGAVAGGAIGYLQHGVKGAIAGAAIGVGGGYLIGHVMDNRRCALYKIAQANHLRLVSAYITQAKLDQQSANGGAATQKIGVDVQLENAPDEFAPGSAVLTPRARNYLSQIAQQYTPKQFAAPQPAGGNAPQEPLHQVLIVGHTDAQDANTGVDLAALSQQRARAVAEVFAENGVPSSSIYYQGAGDSLPLVSNATAEGRRENQRVQIIDVPTAADLQKYLQLRSANPNDFATSQATPAMSSDIQATQASGSFSSQITQEQQPTSAEPPPPNPADPLWERIEEKAKRLAWEQAHPAKQHQAHSSTATSASPEMKSRTTIAQAESRPNGPTVEHLAQQSRQMAKMGPPPAAISTYTGYDFGGAPAHRQSGAINLGEPITHSMFSILNSAQAAAPVVLTSCMNDVPHTSTPVRNLATGEALAPRYYLAGFDNNVWASNVHGNLVAITGATVPVDAGAPVPTPKVLIYRDYHGNTKQAPNFDHLVPVNVYRGSNSTVYRLFVHGPAECIDLVVPARQFSGKANLYYVRSGSTYQAQPGFSVQR